MSTSQSVRRPNAEWCNLLQLNPSQQPVLDYPKLLEEFDSRIGKATSIHIGTHLNPDGDALGCALAVAHYVTLSGKKAQVYCHDPAPPYLSFLPGSETIINQPPESPPDLAIVVDLEALDRLGKLKDHFAQASSLIIIDHHIPHEAPGDMRIVDPTAPATAAILADLWEHSQHQMTPEIAECLLTGVVTDTGSFRYPNTTPHTLNIAARLLEAGADIAKISETVYQSRDLPAVKLLGAALERMQLESDERIAYVSLPLSIYDKVGAKEADTEGIVNELLSIKSVQIAATIRESKSGKIRASLRSRGDIDVAAAAQQMGGGGHKNAAGISVETTLQQAEKQIVELLKKCLDSS